MTKQSTPVLVEHVNTVLAAVAAHGLDAVGMHVRTDRLEGWRADSRVTVQVDTVAQLLAWTVLHPEIGHFTLTEWGKGTNLHYRAERETLDWFIWSHTPGVTAEELLPGVDVEWAPIEDEKRRYGRVTVDQLRAAVNR